jgi:glycosyltransferase involved in cell wall biosynthesis
MQPEPTHRRPLSEIKLSIVLPVFNESAVLDELLQSLIDVVQHLVGDYEVVFVNDGSTDGSAAVLDRLAAANQQVRVVHFSRNFGHQAAVQAGLAHAGGDAVVLMDSDMQDSPAAIGQFLAQWSAGYDVVYAIRADRKENAAKRWAFATFHRLLASISSTPIPADAGNFSLMDARVVRHVIALEEHDRYLPGLRAWVGFKQIGVVVERGARYDDNPRVSLLGLWRLAKTAIFSFSSVPLSAFTAIGYLAMALFVGLSGFSLFCKLFTELAIPGWTSYILIASFFGAINALGISIVGEYVVRIYDQVRQRPIYLVDRKVNFQQPAKASESPLIEELESAIERELIES